MNNLKVNEIYQGDCLKLMPRIISGSIDMILCDLPYGITDCKWDIIIPFKPLWKEYIRIIKDNGAIVLFGNQPFTTDLINSCRELFKYELIWVKGVMSSPLLAKQMPLKSHENILVFYKKHPIYNPQMVRINNPSHPHRGFKSMRVGGVKKMKVIPQSINNFYQSVIYPKSVIYINPRKCELNYERLHPTQKPIDLCNWLIRTYTNSGDLVLDNCIGSRTTAIACLRSKRKFIGIELDEKYFKIAQERIEIEKIRGGE